MRCPRCEFENLPGLGRCFRCGSVLESAGAVAEVYPPRMAGWKRPLRAGFRRLRKFRVVPIASRRFQAMPAWVQRFFRLPKWLPRLARDEFWGMVLSIIPGLGHGLQGRFRAVRWYCLGWAVSLGLSIYFYGSTWGVFFFGMTIGLHAYIAYHAAVLNVMGGLRRGLMILAIIALYLLAIYWGVRRVVFHDLIGQHAAMTIPYQNIAVGDLLLGRRSLARQPLERGMVVQYYPVTVVGNMQNVQRLRDRLSIGEVVGLAGEIVELKNGQFLINGQSLDPNIYPVPRWLRNLEMESIIPAGSYFISSEFLYGQMNVTEQMIMTACIVRAREIEARVILRWWPLGKRGFLKDVE